MSDLVFGMQWFYHEIIYMGELLRFELCLQCTKADFMLNSKIIFKTESCKLCS